VVAGRARRRKGKTGGNGLGGVGRVAAGIPGDLLVVKSLWAEAEYLIIARLPGLVGSANA